MTDHPPPSLHTKKKKYSFNNFIINDKNDNDGNYIIIE